MACKSLKEYKMAQSLDGDTEVMKVLVGSGAMRKKFTVHKALLKKSSSYWANNEAFESDVGKKGIILLKDEDPEAWNLFVKWLYTSQVPKSSTSIPVKGCMPTAVEAQVLELDLLNRFNEHSSKLVSLYGLAEKYNIENLMNRTIDNIQDGYHEYGTVFGPGLLSAIFQKTKPGSKLRDLCVGAVLIHMDYGCSQLRQEIMVACMIQPGFFSHMLTWISRNFSMFGRRHKDQVTDPQDKTQQRNRFSMLNRAKLCPCHFHVHKNATSAHKDHGACAIPFLDCSHGEVELVDRLPFNLTDMVMTLKVDT